MILMWMWGSMTCVGEMVSVRAGVTQMLGMGVSVDVTG
jgi:hypothetical protein